MKLTPGPRRILERVARQGIVMEVQITANGARSSGLLAALCREGYVRRGDHPTVIDRRSGLPAAAVEITEAGKVALEAKP